MSRMIADGTIVARPGDDDPGAIALMHKLSQEEPERWPASAVDFPTVSCRRPRRSQLDASLELDDELLELDSAQRVRHSRLTMDRISSGTAFGSFCSSLSIST